MKKNFTLFCDKFVRNKKVLLLPFLFLSMNVFGQVKPNPSTENWELNSGILATILLTVIVLLIAVIIVYMRLLEYIRINKEKKELKRKKEFSEELIGLDAAEIERILEKRKSALNFQLSGSELSGESVTKDEKGIVAQVTHDPNYPVVEEKTKSNVYLETAPELKKIIIWFIGASAFWLIFGTTVGQYVGMKFIWPEMESISWLSFGRLRPVHTNTVFWGWSSMAMIGLGYFVIARTSNTKIHSYKWAWRSWWLINIAIVAGNLFLMSGINNGGGEYREYIWPATLLFAVGLIITFVNFYKTVAQRKIKEIYVSNWYLLGGMGWTIILVIIGYIPSYQDGLGETVIQGYYMHQGVGMWFMTFTLGLIYYYLPSSLNKPIYSYSLGVLAFWTQMLFYTLIGTHHFVFSPLPWWLQTVAIVFSIGMFIPVIAGTTNFLMTMRGSWSQIKKSYVLPFFLVGVIFYFVGSSQGSIQALRFTNFVWHFTDFNVAHSHMTMYGIIAFILWACIYAIVPKITGKEPKQFFIGMHFWLAFIGLFAYMISLMAGGTLKGLSWIEGEPFIESVILMQPYWVWRAIGGSLMLISHIIFAYNFYVMTKNNSQVNQLSESEFKTKNT